MPAANEYGWTDHAAEQVDKRFPGHDRNHLIAGSVALAPHLVNDWRLDQSGGKTYRIHDQTGCILAIGDGKYGDPVVVTVLERSKIYGRLPIPKSSSTHHPAVVGNHLGKTPDPVEYWQTPLPEVDVKPSDDAEIAALVAVVAAFKSLSPEAVQRILKYLLDRYVDNTVTS